MVKFILVSSLIFGLLCSASAVLNSLRGGQENSKPDHDRDDDIKKGVPKQYHDGDDNHNKRIPGTPSSSSHPISGFGVVSSLPETLTFSPDFSFDPNVTDPSAMFGSGAPSTSFMPPPSDAAPPMKKKSSMNLEVYGSSLFASFTVKDTATANGGGYGMPPDNNVCAGNNLVALLVNSALRVYGTSGNILKTVSFTGLFGGTARGSFFDPVCVYDAIQQRWIIAVDYALNDASGNLAASGFYIMVSNTADLAGAYRFFYIELKSFCNNGANCFVDFPTFGIDKYAIWLSFNKFANNGGFLGSAIFALPKVKLYSLVASTTLSYCTWDNVKYGTSSLFTIQPARVPFGATPVDGTQYAITNYNANSVVKFTFTGTNNLATGTCAGVGMTSTLITSFTTTMSRPPASITQKSGSKLDVGDGRMGQVTLSGPLSSTLFFSRTVATGTGTTTGVAVYAIDRATNAKKFQGVLAFAGWSVWDSAVTVNANGFGVIVSSVLPPITGTNTISSLITSFSLTGGIGATGSTNYPNTANLCGFTTPTLRTGDYSGADINSDGTAFVVSMTAAGLCTGAGSLQTNWVSTVTKVVLQ